NSIIATRPGGSAAPMVLATVVFPEPVPPAMPTTSDAMTSALVARLRGDPNPLAGRVRELGYARRMPAAVHRERAARAPGAAAAPRSRRAALFDMARTLIRKETASLYVRFQVDSGEATWSDMLRTMVWVAQYTFGVLDVERVAR